MAPDRHSRSPHALRFKGEHWESDHRVRSRLYIVSFCLPWSFLIMVDPASSPCTALVAIRSPLGVTMLPETFGLETSFRIRSMGKAQGL